MQESHAHALFSAFIKPERVDRYLALLENPGRRSKLRVRLAHLHDLDPRFARRLTPAEATPASLEALLRAKGAPHSCYCVSESPQLDGQELPLAEALDQVVGHSAGTFLSCVPGRLAYFEGEEPNERYLLERPAA